MSPQFVDFNADGHTDIVTATYAGCAFLVPGSAEGFKEPVNLVDSQGRNIQLSAFWNDETEMWDKADRSPAGKENAEDHCVSAVAMDWDADGDLDLLLGSYEGRLYLQMNEGKAGAPSFTGENHLLTAGGEPFEVPGGLTAPRLVDWNDDGRMDIVCGGFDGGAFLYIDAGRVGEPAFEAPRKLLERSTNGPDGPRLPTSGCYVDPVDYDGDGDLDLLVGGYAEWTPAARELTEEEQARIAELEEQMRELQEEMMEFYEKIEEEVEALDDEAKAARYQELYESPDFVAVSGKHMAVFEELNTLRPGPQRESSIWLYRQM